MTVENLAALLPPVCLLLGALFGAILGRHGKDPSQRKQLVPRGDIVGGLGFSLTAFVAWIAAEDAGFSPQLSFLPLASLLIGLLGGIIIGSRTGAKQ